MPTARPYKREHYRVSLPITYPVVFSDQSTIGEGVVTDLSVFGCAIECRKAVPSNRTLLVRLLLPDQKDSLPIEQAEVRWVKGNQVGIRFGPLERKASLRLHSFVWDRMFERLQRLKEEGALKGYF